MPVADLEETMNKIYGMVMLRRAFGVAAITLTLATTAALAQTPPTRIRGQIEKADGPMLSLKTRDGSMMNVKVADDARVSALVKATVADIKPDTFIGIAGMPQPDGSIQAFSIHIPPAAARGNGEGERPWDARPGSTMTNAYAVSVVSADGKTLMVKSKEGEKKVLITPTTLIAAAAPGNKSELVAGAQLIIMASEKQPDGTVVAKSMYVGRGLTPAM
jgi:hypothetical protein